MRVSFYAFLAAIVFVVFGMSGCKPAKSQSIIFSYTPIPCTGTNVPAGCQTALPGYQNSTPTPTPTPASTATPISVAPNSLSFVNQLSASQTSTISEGSYSSGWMATAPPGGVVSVTVSSNTVTVSPLAAGSGTITVQDSGTGTAPLYFTVGPTPTPTPGPVVASPTSLTFASSGSAAQTVAVSQTNSSNSYTASVAPSGIVSLSAVVSGVLTVTPVSSGNASITINGANSQSVTIPVYVTPAATPPPTVFAFPTPFGGTNPAPVSTTFPQESNITVTAVVKCTSDQTGNTIAQFGNSWVLKAGLCDGSSNTLNNLGLQFYDTANNQITGPSTNLTNGATYFLAGQVSGTGMTMWVCPQSTTPAWTCGTPTTVSYTGNLGTGTNPGYIGAEADGVSQLMSGDIWDLDGYSGALTGTQVQTLAFGSRLDPYTVAPPGPLTANVTSLNFTSPTAGNQTVTLTDPNCTGCTYSASTSPTGVVSTSVSGNVITVTPQTANTTTLTIGDGGYNTLTIPVTVNSASPTVPSPVFTDPAPGATPTTIPALPITSTTTFVAMMDCLVSNTTGVSIISGASQFTLKGGLCNASAPTSNLNPTGTASAQMYDPITGSYGAPTYSLITGNTYMVAGSVDSTNHLVSMFVCAFPYTTNDCSQYSAADTETWTSGNIVGYVGLGTDGASRPSTGLIHVWQVADYNVALTLAQINVVAANIPVTTDPYSTPPTVSVPIPAVTSNWVNAAGLIQVIDPRAARANIKARSASAAAYYSCRVRDNHSTWTPSNPQRCVGGTVQPTSMGGADPGWAPYGSVGASFLNRGAGVVYATCFPNTTGCTALYYKMGVPSNGYSGYSRNIDNVIIPYGAYTQNSFSTGCDCHLTVIEPLGWVPHSFDSPVVTYPDICVKVSGVCTEPYQYELEFENAKNNASLCTGDTYAISCKVFTNGTTTAPSTVTMGATDAGFMTTGSSGFTGTTNTIANGFGPGSSVPSPWGFAGEGVHGGLAVTALQVSAQDIAQGAINHAVGLGMTCFADPDSDVWPGLGTGAGASDTTCASDGSGGPGASHAPYGYTYNAHLWLQPSGGPFTTFAQEQVAICNDGSGHAIVPGPGTTCVGGDAIGVTGSTGWPAFNTPIQVMLAYAMAGYGMVTIDTGGSFSYTWILQTSDGNPGWQQVGKTYNLKLISKDTGTNNAYQVNATIPVQYLETHLYEINSCVLVGAPDYQAGRTTVCPNAGTEGYN